ncbi:MAG: PEGA domain-containing protein [Methanoregula sp.]|nr:PEGA domain-containing protein [Methanoregula sp.]
MAEFHPYILRWTLLVVCTALLISVPAMAFTAESLDITIAENGDATAVFRFTLEGLLENAIPQSMLEEQLVNGLAGSTEPPQLLSMDRSSATLLIKKFANTYDAPTGKDYQTGSMDFKKAEIALQNSAVSSVVSADFSPTTATVTFPDGFSRSFSNVEALPSLTHTVVDPAKSATATADATKGSIKVLASPAQAGVYIDDTYVGNAPFTFDGIQPGTHNLRFQKDGYTPVTRTVNVSAGRTLQVSVFLASIPPTTTPSSAPGSGGLLAALAGCVLIWSFRRE